MSRVDLSETIRRIDFPESVWEWLDLYGEVIGITEQEALYRDESFLADSPFKKLMLCAINKDLSTLKAIYILLRCEMIHQASSHVRLLCESLITLKFISLEAGSRADLFWNYSDIEAFKISSSTLKWKEGKAHPRHVARLKEFQNSILESYKKAEKTYSFTNRKGKRKPCRNWCNKTIAEQAIDCGSEFSRLYELVYRQMSSYIHGSAWSLRRQTSYSRKHYLIDVVLNDIAAIVRTTIVVWVEWAKFCILEMDWQFTEALTAIPKRLEELEDKHFS